MENQKNNVLLKLFTSTLYLSTFTFGGGYVIVTLLKDRFVDHYHWIDEEEMLDLVAIAQSSPGAIAVNGAIVVGYKLAGIPGVLISVVVRDGTVIIPDGSTCLEAGDDVIVVAQNSVITDLDDIYTAG